MFSADLVLSEFHSTVPNHKTSKCHTFCVRYQVTVTIKTWRHGQGHSRAFLALCEISEGSEKRFKVIITNNLHCLHCSKNLCEHETVMCYYCVLCCDKLEIGQLTIGIN